MRQLRIFQRMVEKGAFLMLLGSAYAQAVDGYANVWPELIYTAHRPVAYSPSSRSALAEAELEYSDSHVSTSVYIAYALDSHVNSVARPALPIDNEARVELLVWTTTPWTLSANMVPFAVYFYSLS
jgi:isoleucyl-tRNA synthetase